MPTVQRLDASESFWFARELEAIKAQILVREIPEFKGRALVPVASGVPAGSAVYTYQELDEVGIAAFVNGFAKDLPRVDVVGRETSSPIRPIGASYGYTTANIRQARLTGRSLPLAKAEAAMRAIEAKIDLTCQVGDVPQGIRGLFTLVGVNTYVIPNGGAGSPLWSTKTADEILAAWRQPMLAAPSPRAGCARTLPLAMTAPPVEGVGVGVGVGVAVGRLA